MAREYKFRFWVEKASKMSDWETAKKECDRLSLLAFEGFIPMQFTGAQTDKGEDIYDGDIVDGVYTEGYGPEATRFNCRSVVSWDNQNGKWIVTDIPSGEVFDLYDYDPLDYIVGNIYETPELWHATRE